MIQWWDDYLDAIRKVTIAPYGYANKAKNKTGLSRSYYYILNQVTQKEVKRR